MDAILQNALKEGLGYALFCFLLFYVLKTQATRDEKSEKREEKYQEIINNLSEKIATKIEHIEDDIKEMLRK